MAGLRLGLPVHVELSVNSLTANPQRIGWRRGPYFLQVLPFLCLVRNLAFMCWSQLLQLFLVSLNFHSKLVRPRPC